LPPPQRFCYSKRMSQDVPWLRYRGESLRVACPVCGSDSCHVQTVAVCQKGLDVAVARRHVLSIEGPRGKADYRVEVRFFCEREHRFAVRYVFGGLAAAVSCEELPHGGGLPLLELER
jgi:hypothetical protein